MSNKTCYFLGETSRVYNNSGLDIRIRKGVWNFVEASIDLDGQSENTQTFFSTFFETLRNHGEVEFEQLASQCQLNEQESNDIKQVLDRLAVEQYLKTSSDKTLEIVNEILGIIPLADTGDKKPTLGRGLFISDSEYANNLALTLAEEVGMSLDILEPDDVKAIGKLDLTSKTDAVDYKINFNQVAEKFVNADFIVGTFEKPNLRFLRNLNRVLIEHPRPISLGLVDGPFSHAFTIDYPNTNCFECFENRIMARLEDLVSYDNFVKNEKIDFRKLQQNKAPLFAPTVHILVSTVISEAYLLASTRLSKLSGRVLSVYWPIIEIQVQDLYRIPYCPACGYLSTSIAEETYLATKNIVNRVLEKVKVTG